MLCKEEQLKQQSSQTIKPLLYILLYRTHMAVFD